MNFFDELKRRNVIRVALAYVVLGWVVMQVADIIVPTLGLPEWSMRLVLLLLTLGFPVVVVFSWVYEITPEGIKRERDMVRTDSITQETAKKLNIAVIVLLIIAIGVNFIPVAPRSPVLPAPEAVDPVPDPTPVEAAAPSVDDASIAVLPFVNMSADEDNVYFSDGLSEELLNVLAKVDGLKVTSRTSSFAFKGQDFDIQTVAAKLLVRYVLEGSVRKAGNEVRITAQLIDAESDTHVWSEAYDRRLENIFEIQTEIAGNIVRELRSVLGHETEPAAVTVAPPTEDLAAYDEYLQGRFLFLRRGEPSLRAAVGHLERALELDPEFARAWSQLASVRVVLPSYTDNVDRAQDLAKARQAAERALELDPGMAEAHSVLAQLAYHELRPYEEIDGLFSKAIELNPKDHQPRLWLGLHYLRYGHIARAKQVLEEAFRLDPTVGIISGWLGLAYHLEGQTQRARTALRRAADAGWENGLWGLMDLAVIEGDRQAIDALLEELEPLQEKPFPDWQADLLIAHTTGTISPELLSRARHREGMDPGTSQWRLYVRIGELESALEELELNLQEGAMGTMPFVWDHFYEPLPEHPRFLEIVERFGYVRGWESQGYPDHCRRAADRLECDFPKMAFSNP